MTAHSNFRGLLLVAFWSLFTYVHAAGWSLDASCSGDLADKVRASMNLAFGMATDAATELGKSPLNNDVLTVYSHLFMNTDDVRNNKVKKVFDSIVGMRGEVPKDIGDSSTVIVYCNLDRLRPLEDPGWLWDSDVQRAILYAGDQKATVDNCKSSNPLRKQYTLAYVENQENRFKPSASQLTICPWYLDHSFHQKFDESKGYKLRRITASLFETLWEPLMATEIDGMADLPVTLLHELSHSTEAGSVGLGGGRTGDDLGYGWKHITADTSLGHTNADNYAYFGLAINRMKDTLDPRLVQPNGKMQEMVAPLTRRLIRALEWFA